MGEKVTRRNKRKKIKIVEIDIELSKGVQEMIEIIEYKKKLFKEMSKQLGIPKKYLNGENTNTKKIQ